MIYDEDQGDARHSIPAGTRFQDLPEDYECPGCYSERLAYSPVRTTRSLRAASISVMPPRACYDVKAVSDK